jgi:hypothetical protein
MRPSDETPTVTVTVGVNQYPAGDFRAAVKLLRSLPDDFNGLASVIDKKKNVTHFRKEGRHVHSVPTHP